MPAMNCRRFLFLPGRRDYSQNPTEKKRNWVRWPWRPGSWRSSAHLSARHLVVTVIPNHRPGQRQPSSAVVSPHKGHGDRGNPQHDSEPRGLGSNAIWIFVVPPDVPVLKSSKAVHSQKKKLIVLLCSRANIFLNINFCFWIAIIRTPSILLWLELV